MTGGWAGTTFGNNWLHGALVSVLRYTDARIVWFLASVFVVPFCLLLNSSRKTAYSYFRYRMGFGRCRSAWLTYVNHCSFAGAVIDKFAMYAGKKFDIDIRGVGNFNNLAAKEEGFLHFSSHIGNYEIAGYSLVSDRKSINAVVYAEEKASVMENRGRMFCRTNINMIALKPDMSHLFEIDRALCNGDIVSFPADRLTGGKFMECKFLGADAKFPQGPFSVAAMRGLEVLAVNVMKEGPKKYVIYVTPLDYDRTAPRREQMQGLLEGYVAELERMLRKYPAQWYNFYDFWA